MGAVQSIPVVGETATVVDSSVKFGLGLYCGLIGVTFNIQKAKDDAGKFLKDAGNSWVEYSERSVLFAPVRATIHDKTGEKQEAERVFNKMLKSTEQCIDNTPVVGHVKGVCHYIAGDTEHGHECMKGASRTLVVAGAGAVTGGVGGGLVLGGIAGAAGGVAYDGILSGGEPYGTIASIKQASESFKKNDFHGFLSSAVNLGYSVTGDYLTGATVAEGVSNYKQKEALKTNIGEEATNDVIDAGKKLQDKMKNASGDNHVCTKAKNLETGKEAYGTNKRLRQELRVNEFESKGKASGYNSKTNARKGNPGELPREKGILIEAAERKNMDIKKVGTRDLNSCAEHEAIHNLGTTGDKAKLRLVTVGSKNGKPVTLGSCDNCKKFGDLMGDVVTDNIDGMPVPTHQFSWNDAGTVWVCGCCGESEDDCSCY